MKSPPHGIVLDLLHLDGKGWRHVILGELHMVPNFSWQQHFILVHLGFLILLDLLELVWRTSNKKLN